MKLTSLQRKAEEENKPNENIFLERLKEFHPPTVDVKENNMVSEVILLSCQPRVTVTSYFVYKIIRDL